MSYDEKVLTRKETVTASRGPGADAGTLEFTMSEDGEIQLLARARGSV
jgi:hypothetical protein